MKIKRIATFMLCLALLITMGGSSLSPFFMKAEAATNKYSNVLDDLKKDKNFNPDDYPSDSTKNHLEVIQIAEGENGDLFIYVYQPGKYTKEYRAKYINMAREDRSNRNPNFNIYSLTYVNSNGVFDKYVVNNFVVSNETYRYYNIAAVYRAFDKDVDDKSEGVDGIDCKGFSVGLVWCAYHFNGDVVYECEKVEVVEITIHDSGTVRYDEGFKLYVDKCDSYYVAFSIDNFDVEKIFDADIRFTYRSKEVTTVPFDGTTTTYSDGVSVQKFLSVTDTGSNKGDGLFGKKYTWNRIQTVDSFITQVEDVTNEKISDEALETLKNSDFVFQFFESTYSISSYSASGITIKRSTEVSEFGILRLHFLSEGKVYNLGVVSDLVSIDDIPEFEITIGDNFVNEDWWQILVSLLCLVVLACFCGPLFAALFGMILSFLRTGLSVLVQLFLFIISLPFRLFKQKK